MIWVRFVGGPLHGNDYLLADPPPTLKTFVLHGEGGNPHVLTDEPHHYRLERRADGGYRYVYEPR